MPDRWQESAINGVSTGWRVALVFALVACNAFFVLSEYALVTARRWRLVELTDAGDRGAAIAVPLLEQPMMLIGTVQVGISSLGIALGALGEPTFRRLLNPVVAAGVSVVLALVATTYLYVVLGELVPRAIVLDRTERVAAAVARPLVLLGRALHPVVWLLQGSAAAILRPLGFRPISARLAVRSEEELRGILAEAEETGIIEEAEEEMIYKVFDFADTEVSEVMVPRPDIAAISVDTPVRECLAVVIDSPYTRHPVHRGNLDNVIGVPAPPRHLLRLLRRTARAHDDRAATAARVVHPRDQEPRCAARGIPARAPTDGDRARRVRRHPRPRDPRGPARGDRRRDRRRNTTYHTNPSPG